jgi:hypothetical protein
MSSIQAGTLAANAIVYSTDTTGNLVFKTGASGNTALTLDTNQLATFANGISVTGNVSGNLTVTGNTTTGNLTITGRSTSNSSIIDSVIVSPYTGFKNRIINGAMLIDQRYAGVAVTVNSSTATYGLDRWRGFGQSSAGVFTIQQNAVAPSGFANSINIKVSTANTTIPAAGFYTLQQAIEGYNISDLNWGTSSARNITLSFQANSSVTGTHSGSVKNSDGTRSYPFTYSIASANTWTPVSITVPGDTTGTWLTNTSIGLTLTFNLGSGRVATANAWAAGNYDGATSSANVISTAGATFFVTGVQVEAGNTATSFEFRPYTSELQLCQRYYYKVITTAAAAEVLAPSGWAESTTAAYCYTTFPVMMRAAPTALEQTGTAANYNVRYVLTSAACSSVPTFNNGSIWGARTIFTVASGLTAGQAVAGQTASTAGVYLGWSAEL